MSDNIINKNDYINFPPEAQEIIRKQNAVILKQNMTIAELMARIAELESRLNMNSTNSSKPPSTLTKLNTRIKPLQFIPRAVGRKLPIYVFFSGVSCPFPSGYLPLKRQRLCPQVI